MVLRSVGPSRPRLGSAPPAGGYRWIYLDGVSDDGASALTLIAMLGSVFSPHYAAARARRPDADPLEHCAMNVAIYGASRNAWCLTERARSEVALSSDELRIGTSGARWAGDTLEFDLDERTAPFGGRVRGKVSFRPAGWTALAAGLDRPGHHAWLPIAPSGRVTVELQSPGLRFEGHGYLDSNEGTCGLEDSFRAWTWTRATGTDGTSLVSYDTQERSGVELATCLLVDRAGTPQEREPLAWHALPSTWWGIERRIRGDAGHSPVLLRTLESTPFYSRSLVAVRAGGRDSVAVHETLSADRFRTPWVQFLIPFRMRGPGRKEARP